jgi:hypothetical protein
MSLSATALVLAVVLVEGSAAQGDEGAAAHVFQLLIAAQLPIMAFFAVKWLPRYRLAALSIIGLQFIALGFAFFPVWAFGL